jgi:hypothetical protein
MGTKQIDGDGKRDRLYEYADYIVKAKLDGGAKGLLWFYAYHYNWKLNRRSFWTEEKICAHTSMAPSTYQSRRKYLEELGWIDCVKVGLKQPLLVKPTVGNDDPEYETKHWAKWHPSNIQGVSLEALAVLSDEALLLESERLLALEEATNESVIDPEWDVPEEIQSGSDEC